MAARSIDPKMADEPTRPSELPPEGQRNLKSQYHEVAYASTWFSSLDRLKFIRISQFDKTDLPKAIPKLDGITDLRLYGKGGRWSKGYARHLADRSNVRLTGMELRSTAYSTSTPFSSAFRD